MDAPRIQYAKTSDGVSIAYWALNEGPALVYLPITPFSHVQLEWQIPDCRRWYELLAGGRMLVRFDGRGTGLSDRDAADFSLAGQLRDLDAVIERLGLERFVLFGAADSGMTAMAYAARNPERVLQLILWCTWACRAQVSRTAPTQALRALLDEDWEVYTETAARVILGWKADTEARQFAAFYRQCTTPEVLRSAVGAVYETDVSPDLANIRCPALVLHRRQIPTPDMAVMRNLAARIPNAHLVVLDGDSPMPFVGDMISVLRAVREFMGDAVVPEATVAEEAAGAPVIILFTDMAGSTPLTERLGDAGAQELIRAHNAIVRQAMRSHSGREVKHTGDGIMASFASASRALECAIDIQRAVAAHQQRQGEALLNVKIGVNAGEPIAEEHDLFGTAVIMTERICGMAAPGQILVSEVVRGLTAGKRFLLADQGEKVLRGFEDAVRVYEVRW